MQYILILLLSEALKEINKCVCGRPNHVLGQEQGKGEQMGLRIGTNIAALSAIRQMRSSQSQTEKAMAQLASGSRFAGSNTENPADHSISEHLRGQVMGLKASRMNAENAISFIQVAEGGLNEQNNILIRMRELAIQSASDTVSEVERGFLNEEFQGLNQELDRISKTTKYGSTNLLSGIGKKFTFQVGANSGPENRLDFTLSSDTSSTGLGVNQLSVRESDEALDSIENIDEGLNRIGQARASFGAIQNRLQSVVNHLSSQEYNIEDARSKIADTDVAQAVTQMTLGNIRSQFQTAVLAQANTLPQNALKLLA